jgi:hypothetical protein
MQLRIGEVPAQYCLCCFVDFNLCDARHADALKAQIKPADTAEQ